MRRRRWVSLALIVALLVGGATATVLARGESPPSLVVLARADNPVDALGASAVAAQLGGVVLLTSKSSLSEGARTGLLAADPDLVILAGGTAALSDQVKMDVENLGYTTRRVSGPNRVDTAAAMAGLVDEYGAGYVRLTDSGARAQAVVWGGTDPALDPARSFGFTAVTSPLPGVYCLTLDPGRGIDLSTSVALTSIEWGDSIGANLVAHWNGESTGGTDDDCAAGEVDISTYTTDGNLTTNASFVVVVP